MTTGKIRIISTVPGFRRGGISHPADRTYPAGRFTEEELEVFRAEPVLRVLEGDEIDHAEQRAATYSTMLSDANAENAALKAQLAEAEARLASMTAERDDALAEIATLKKAAEKKTGGK